MNQQTAIAAADPAKNPLLAPWNNAFQVPPFEVIVPEHFVPAFEQAMAEHDRDITAIVATPAAPDFDNTIAALEWSGTALSRVSDVFYALPPRMLTAWS